MIITSASHMFITSHHIILSHMYIFITSSSHMSASHIHIIHTYRPHTCLSHHITSASCVAGAVFRAARKVCGTRCRRWAPVALCGRCSIQSGYKGLRCAASPLGAEPLEGVAARGVAAGRRPYCRRIYIGVCRGGVCVKDLCRRSYIGACRGGVCVTYGVFSKMSSPESGRNSHLQWAPPLNVYIFVYP